MTVYSEVLEFFGGIGYCEDSNLPVYLRDGQTLTIWEGTTNVLSLDFIRALQKDEGALSSLNQFFARVFIENVFSEAKTGNSQRNQETIRRTILKYNQLAGDLNSIFKQNKLKDFEFFVRDIAFGTSRLLCAAYLLQHFLISGLEQDLEIFLRWVNMKELYAPELGLN